MGVAVVTGASRGIGRAIAIALAAEGHDLVAIARGGDSLEALGTAVKAQGVRFVGLAVDLSSSSASVQAGEQAWGWQGGVTVLVNAAGALIRKPEADLTTEEFDRTFALNVRAPFLLMERLGRLMVEQGGGSIVNVASIAGEVVTQAPGPYQASKAALIQLTRYYAVQLAPNVRVNAVGPGYVRTDLTRSWLSDPANEDWVRQRTPLGRVGEPEDVAAAVVFLASDRASYITGQHLRVDGGWTVP